MNIEKELASFGFSFKVDAPKIILEIFDRKEPERTYELVAITLTKEQCAQMAFAFQNCNADRKIYRIRLATGDAARCEKCLDAEVKE